MKNKKLKWVAVSTLVGIVASILTIVGCNKSQTEKTLQAQSRAIFNNYDSYVGKTMPIYADYVFNQILKGEYADGKYIKENIIHKFSLDAPSNITASSEKLSEEFIIAVENLKSDMKNVKTISDLNRSILAGISYLTDIKEKEDFAYVGCMGKYAYQYVNENEQTFKDVVNMIDNNPNKFGGRGEQEIKIYNTAQVIPVIAKVWVAVNVIIGAVQGISDAGRNCKGRSDYFGCFIDNTWNGIKKGFNRALIFAKMYNIDKRPYQLAGYRMEDRIGDRFVFVSL